MLDKIVPRQIDNTYRGYRIALWIFGLVVVVRMVQSVAILANGYATVRDADGIPLETYTADAAQTVLGLFALVSLWRLIFGLLSLLVLVRYRAAVPLMFLLSIAHYLGAQAISLYAPLVRIGTPPGSIVNLILFGLTVVGLVLSLIDRRGSAVDDPIEGHAASARRFDPYKNFKFRVKFDSKELAVLDEIVEQGKQRSAMNEESRRGVSALFVGQKGTGKRMAAEVIADQLGSPLQPIDLSAVSSKYIGETEKNLNRVFDAAEEAGAILFFEEADALFGKRSEVKDSHDRYANIEIDYLLQRLESYCGIAILTTNRKEDLDPAFLRRIRFIVNFPPPGETTECP